MAFYLRASEANTRETLSLSLRLRDARARAWAYTFGKCSVFVRCLFGVCSAKLKNQHWPDRESSMGGQFQDILDSLPEKPPRSRLEPYRELIDELRRRGRTFREIADLLGEKCHVETAASTIHDFVRIRSRREQRSGGRSSAGTIKSTKAPIPQGIESAPPAAKAVAAVDEVRRKIASLKARKSVVEQTPEGFQFDPGEPLRLKKPGKKADE